MFLSSLYVVLQRVLQIVGLLRRSTEFKELEIVVLRHEAGGSAPAGPAARVSAGRSIVLSGCESIVATRHVVIFPRHPGDASALASILGGEPLDVRASSWPAADLRGCSLADRAIGPGKSAMGISTDCG